MRHRFGALRVGGFAVRGAMVDLQRGIAVDVLGLDFLKDEVAAAGLSRAADGVRGDGDAGNGPVVGTGGGTEPGRGHVGEGAGVGIGIGGR